MSGRNIFLVDRLVYAVMIRHSGDEHFAPPHGMPFKRWTMFGWYDTEPEAAAIALELRLQDVDAHVCEDLLEKVRP